MFVNLVTIYFKCHIVWIVIASESVFVLVGIYLSRHEAVIYCVVESEFSFTTIASHIRKYVAVYQLLLAHFRYF